MAQLAQLESTLGTAKAFDPKTSESHWRVSLSDLGEMMFLPALAKALREEAPMAHVSNVAVGVEEVSRALMAREIDFSIGILPSKHPSVRSEKLFEERYVAVTSQQWRPSKAVTKSKLQIEQLQRAKLVVAAPTATFHGGVEKILQTHNLTRQVVLRTRHFGAIPELTLHTDLLAIVPAMYAHNMARTHQLRVWELPSNSVKYAVNLLWHASTDSETEQVYVRDKVRALFARAS